MIGGVGPARHAFRMVQSIVQAIVLDQHYIARGFGLFPLGPREAPPRHARDAIRCGDGGGGSGEFRLVGSGYAQPGVRGKRLVRRNSASFCLPIARPIGNEDPGHIAFQTWRDHCAAASMPALPMF